MKFTRVSLGCHGGGNFGHSSVRGALADEVSRFDEELAELLRGPMSDDAGEEDEALEILNRHTAPGLVWEFIDGDLVLSDYADHVCSPGRLVDPADESKGAYCIECGEVFK